MKLRENSVKRCGKSERAKRGAWPVVVCLVNQLIGPAGAGELRMRSPLCSRPWFRRGWECSHHA